MPDSYALAADGLLLVANGIDPVVRWDGLTPEAETAGLAAPASAVTLTGSGAGDITGTYYAYVRYLDRFRNVSNLSALSAAAELSGNSTVTYSSVPSPADPKVVYRQLLRNTAGQTNVFYVDVETEDLTTSSFSSTRTDTLLAAEEAVPLLDEDLRVLANLHGVPPDDRSVIAAHLDRMFLAAEEVYSEGSAAVVTGSATVSGAGTEWKPTFAGRFLWVSGGDKPYEILSCDEATQTLTLADTFAAATNPYAKYAVRPALPRRRLLLFSEAGLPESWPAANAVSVQEDSDEITALMPKVSFLYILCRRHTYRLTFQDSPIKDGFVFFVGGRGCVNNRCWAVVDEDAYLLDEAGVYALGAGQQADDLSAPIQDLFEAGAQARDRQYKVQWAASRWFHAVYDPGQKVVRWFVTLSGQGLPRHALCYDLARKAWWVEEFPFPVGASCVFRLGGEPRVALGGPAGEIYVMNEGSLDLADPRRGTARGVVTTATALTLTASGATFPSDFIGANVNIALGKGKGQARRIAGIDGTTLTLATPWLVLPDSTSTYQVGGVQWRYRTGWFRFSMEEDENPRRLEITFEPTPEEATLDARIYLDRARRPLVWDTDYDQTESMGFASAAGEADLVARLDKPIGFVARRLDGHKELHLDAPRFVRAELAGVSGEDGITLYGVTLDGVSP